MLDIRAHWICLALVAASVVCGPARAMEPAYLDELPAVKQVLADMQVSDRLDTLARQTGAMRQLGDVVARMAGQRLETQTMTADEQRIWSAYLGEAQRISSEVRAMYTQANDPGGRKYLAWNEKTSRYARARDFRDDLFKRYVSADFVARYRGEVQATTERIQSERVYEAPASGSDSLLFGRNWNAMTPSERQGAITFGVLMTLLLLLVTAREFLPFDIDPRNPRRLRAGLRRYRIEWTTGTLTDYHAHEESRTYTEKTGLTDSLGQAKWASRTERTLTETFNITSAEGTHPIIVKTHPAKARPGATDSGPFGTHEGDDMTVVWVTRRRRVAGYLLFYAWATRMQVAELEMSRTIEDLRASKVWSVLPALGLGFAIGNSSDVPLGSIFAAILVAVAWGIFWIWLSGRAVKRFRYEQLPRLIRHLQSLRETPSETVPAAELVAR